MWRIGMGKILINGGKKLFGVSRVSSAKNAYLPILAGAILCDGDVILNNYPLFDDIDIMCEILSSIGIKKKTSKNNLLLDCRDITGHEIPEVQTKLIRSSIVSLGAILGRVKKAKVAYPGGCAIGARPIDLHIKGLRKLNVKIIEEDGYLICDGSNMKSANIHLDFPSVGATENVMMAAATLKGTSRIFNPAKEPEIVDLQNFLNASGAKICGAGTNEIVIEGVQKLGGVNYTPIPDRIITGTLVVACAMTGGEIVIENAKAQHIESLINKIDKYCCNIRCENDKIIVQADGKPKSFGTVNTEPYPGFPTDLQAQLSALACICKGTSKIIENLFETRFKHIPELIKMGAKIEIDGKQVTVDGVKRLRGAVVKSSDLRGGACLVLAGLTAKGQTIVEDVHHIDRGYEHIENIFSCLGADIKRIDDET